MIYQDSVKTVKVLYRIRFVVYGIKFSMALLRIVSLANHYMVILSLQVDADLKTGRFKEAKSASHVARKLNICGLIFGIVQNACIILVVILVIIILSKVASVL